MSRSQREVLRHYGIRPVKRRGQNFLIDGNLARWIADATCRLGGRVLELGAGGGALTTHLLAAAERVVCVEVDRALCDLLRTEFGERRNFELVADDLARLDWAAMWERIGPQPVLAGNLPYVLTSKVLFALADSHRTVAGAILMVQREVAERLTAAPGGSDYGILSVVLGSLFDIEIVRRVPATVFWPPPDVASAVVRLVPARTRTADQPWSDAEYRSFLATVKTLFGQRRKKVATLLRSLYGLTATDAAAVADRADVDIQNRPQRLTRRQWRRLAAVLTASKAG